MSNTRQDKSRRHGSRYRARRRAVDIIFEAEARDIDPVAIVDDRIELSQQPDPPVKPVAPYTQEIVGGVAVELDRVDEVGDQICAPLVLVFDLSPGALHVLVELNHSVVSAREKSVESDEHYGHDGDPKGGLTDDG